VVRNLERDGAHRLAPLEHTGFSDSSEVPREQNRYPSPIEAEDDGVVVGGSAGLAVGIHDRHACVAQPHALARAESASGHASASERRERRFAAQAPASALPELAHVEVTQHRAQPARMIRIRMRERDHVEPAHGAVPEKRRHDALADVERTATAGAAVDQQACPVGQFDEGGVALTDVHEGDAKAPIAWTHERPCRQRDGGGQEQRRGRSHHDAGRAERDQDQPATPGDDSGPRGSRQMHHRARDGGGCPDHDA